MPSRKDYAGKKSTKCSGGKCSSKSSPVKKTVKKTTTKRCKGKLQDGSRCNYSVAAGNKLYCHIHGA